MSGCVAIGCASIGTPGGNSSDECNCTATNIGTGVDHYVEGSVDPFEFRRTAAIGDVVIATISNPNPNDSNLINLSVTNASRGLGDETLLATPHKTSVSGNVTLFLKELVAGPNVTLSSDDNTVTIGSTAGAATAANVGTGIEPYEAGTSNPFNFRRMTNNEDASDPFGDGGVLAFYQDGQTNRIDVPRLYVEDNSSINVNNVLTVFLDHTWTPDVNGVAGIDASDWMLWWSMKICGDPGQPLVDATILVERNDGGVWSTVEHVHSRPVTGLTPSWPHAMQRLLTNTDWTFNGGLRLRVSVATNSLFVTNLFEDLRMTLIRWNKAVP